jgi:hypothetical protein
VGDVELGEELAVPLHLADTGGVLNGDRPLSRRVEPWMAARGPRRGIDSLA